MKNIKKTNDSLLAEAFRLTWKAAMVLGVATIIRELIIKKSKKK